mgnify:CR=1 FL=1
MISLPQKKGLPSITRNSGLKKLNDEIYYSLRTPERILFKVDIEKMSLQPYYAFDFGQHNLNLREWIKNNNSTERRCIKIRYKMTII